MQGASELIVIALIFFGLQAWWLSKVFLFRPKRKSPPSLSQQMRANSLAHKKNKFEKMLEKLLTK